MVKHEVVSGEGFQIEVESFRYGGPAVCVTAVDSSGPGEDKEAVCFLSFDQVRKLIDALRKFVPGESKINPTLNGITYEAPVSRPVLLDVEAERERQDSMWGEQNHEDGTGDIGTQEALDVARCAFRIAEKEDRLTWRHILEEEFCEALAETDPEKLREELIQVAAVAVAWVEAIDRWEDK